ncbi:unnamed protein product [Sphagnum tenellum]
MGKRSPAVPTEQSTNELSLALHPPNAVIRLDHQRTTLPAQLQDRGGAVHHGAAPGPRRREPGLRPRRRTQTLGDRRRRRVSRWSGQGRIVSST